MTVPAPGAGAEQDDGVHLQDVAAEEERRDVGRDGDDEADEQQARPGLLQARRRSVGPALRPTTPMKTARPIVSKTQSAGSGIRPNVGRTERSQPKTSPMMSAPPLAVRLSGRPPTVTVRSADEAAEEDAEADEDDVRLARRALDVAERLPGALDVLAASRRSGGGRPGRRGRRP